MSSVPISTRIKWAARRPGFPFVTWTLIVACVVVFAAQLLGDAASLHVSSWLVYYPPFTYMQPWRIVTAIFAHGGWLHILFNMYSLYVMGSVLEPMLGKWRFLALYLLSGLGGNVAVLLIAPSTSVLGASGAIFGLMGAFLIITRRMGMRNPQFLAIVVLNLVWGFFVSGIAWEAHVGGLIVGAAVGALYFATRKISQQTTQRLGLVGILVALVVVTVIGMNRIWG